MPQGDTVLQPAGAIDFGCFEGICGQMNNPLPAIDMVRRVRRGSRVLNIVLCVSVDGHGDIDRARLSGGAEWCFVQCHQHQNHPLQEGACDNYKAKDPRSNVRGCADVILHLGLVRRVR